MQPTFSVLVTCHNYREYVVEAVESALMQQPPPADVVVVDDGSTDDSFAVLQTRFGANPTVRLTRQDNLGQLAAMAAGLAACGGDIILLLDADDIYAQGYLAALARAYAQPRRVDFTYCDMAFVGGRAGRYSPQHDGPDRTCYIGLSALQTLHCGRWLCSPTSAISVRRALLARALDLPRGLAEEFRINADEVIGFGSSVLGAAKAYIHEPLVQYRIHGANKFALNDSRKNSPADRLLHDWKRKRVIAHFANVMGFGPEHLRSARREFETRDCSSVRDAQDYLNMAWRAPTSSWRRLEDSVAIFRHWWRTRD